MPAAGPARAGSTDERDRESDRAQLDPQMERRRARRPPLARGVRAQEGGRAAAAAPSLQVATAVQKSVPLYGEFVGTLVGVKTGGHPGAGRGLPRQAGVRRRRRREGRPGSLFVIDQRPFLAALAQAVAQLARDEANHAQARRAARPIHRQPRQGRSAARRRRGEPVLCARAGGALPAARQARVRDDEKRFTDPQTLARGAAATVEADKAAIKAAAAAAEASRAAVDQAAAAIQADRAAVTQAELNLSYTTMYAPMAGRIGRRQVDVGNLVGAGQSTLLATIVQLDPIYVYFSLPRARRAKPPDPAGRRVSRDGDDGGARRHTRSRVAWTSSTIRSIPRRARSRCGRRWANPERLLLPGQYAQVRLLMGTRPDVVPRARAGHRGGAGRADRLRRRARQEGPAPHGDGGARIRGPAHRRERDSRPARMCSSTACRKSSRACSSSRSDDEQPVTRAPDLVFVDFFIRRPIFASVARDPDHAGGRHLRSRAAHRAVPGARAAHR